MFSKRQAGFTVIELLTVIAIIGVLAAIIFPVMASSKKKAKQAQCMNNLMQIGVAIKQFKLDEQKYPDFITGPVEWKDGSGAINYVGNGQLVPLDKSTGMVGSRSVSLFPEYMDSASSFKCPLAAMNVSGIEPTLVDIATDPMYAYWGGIPSPGEPRSVRATGVSAGGPAFQLYLYDSYGSQWPRFGPELEAHYAPLWLFVDLTANPGYPDTDPDYERQLWWTTPPADAVVTWCSLHRDTTSAGIEPASKELVLFLDGHVKLMDSTRFANWKTAWREDMPT